MNSGHLFLDLWIDRQDNDEYGDILILLINSNMVLRYHNTFFFAYDIINTHNCIDAY